MFVVVLGFSFPYPPHTCICVCVCGKRGSMLLIRGLMTVFCNVHHDCLLPAEQEVTHAGSQGHGYAQVAVVGHEHQHEEVTDHHLDDVKYRLQKVCQAQHPLSDRKQKQRGNKVPLILLYSMTQDELFRIKVLFGQEGSCHRDGSMSRILVRPKESISTYGP